MALLSISNNGGEIISVVLQRISQEKLEAHFIIWGGRYVIVATFNHNYCKTDRKYRN